MMRRDSNGCVRNNHGAQNKPLSRPCPSLAANLLTDSRLEYQSTTNACKIVSSFIFDILEKKPSDVNATSWLRRVSGSSGALTLSNIRCHNLLWQNEDSLPGSSGNMPADEFNTEDPTYEHFSVSDSENEPDPKLQRVMSIVTGHHRTHANVSTDKVTGKLFSRYGKQLANWREGMELLRQEELDIKKRELKTMLRDHDHSFRELFGYTPMRQHKELVRPLYIIYREMKTVKPLLSDLPLSKNSSNRDSAKGMSHVVTNTVASGRRLRDASMIQDTHSSFAATTGQSQTMIWTSDVPEVAITGVVDKNTSNEDIKAWRRLLKKDLVAYGEMFKETQGREVVYKMDIEPIQTVYDRFKIVQKEYAKRNRR